MEVGRELTVPSSILMVNRRPASPFSGSEKSARQSRADFAGTVASTLKPTDVLIPLFTPKGTSPAHCLPASVKSAMPASAALNICPRT